MRTPAPPVHCRVTVLAPGRRADLALPVDVPLAELVPPVLELLDGAEPVTGPDAPARPEPWRFSGLTGAPLPPAATLADLGVLDGEVLRIGPDAPAPPPPVFDDPVDALAALATGGAPVHRSPPALVALLTTAGAGLLAGAPEAARPAAVALAALGAVLALVRAHRVARSAAGPADDRAALTAACAAVPLAAAAGWAALPTPAGAAHLLLALVAAGAAATLGQVAVRAVAPPLLAATVVTALAGAATAAVLTTGVDVPVAATAAGAAALVTGPLLPRAVLRLAGLPRPVVPTDAAGLVAADHGPDLLPAPELADRARLARGQLAGLSGGCAVTAALAAPVAALPGGGAGPAFAAVTVVVLLLRARSFAEPATARAHLAAGALAAVALAGLAATTGPEERLGGAVALLAAAAVGALGPPRSVASPVVRRALDLGEGVLTAAVVPLALLAAGVFTRVRGL